MKDLLSACEHKAGILRHLGNQLIFVAIKPAFDSTGSGVQNYTQTTERPAIISHRYEVTRRKTVEHTDLAADQCYPSTEAHGADAECIGGLHNIVFQPGQLRIRVDIVKRAKKLLFRMQVAGRSITTDADAERARATSLSLCLPDRVEYALTHTIKITSGLTQVRKFRRQRVLDILILTAAAFEQKLHFDLVIRLPLLEMHGRRTRAQVIPAVCPGD